MSSHISCCWYVVVLNYVVVNDRMLLRNSCVLALISRVITEWWYYMILNYILFIIISIIWFDISPFTCFRHCLYIGNVQVMKNEELVVVSLSMVSFSLIRSTRGEWTIVIFCCFVNWIRCCWIEKYIMLLLLKNHKMLCFVL